MLPSGGWLQYNGRPHYLDIIISHLLNKFFSCCVIVCSFEWLISSDHLNLWLYSMKSEDEALPRGFALLFIFISALYWMSLISASKESARWREGKVDEEKEGHREVGWTYHRGEAEDRIVKKERIWGGKVMAVWMERCEMLHESNLIVHQLYEPHMADKNDEKNNDASWAASPELFLDASKLGCFVFAIGVFQYSACVFLSSRRPGCSKSSAHRGVSGFVAQLLSNCAHGCRFKPRATSADYRIGEELQGCVRALPGAGYQICGNAVGNAVCW